MRKTLLKKIDKAISKYLKSYRFTSSVSISLKTSLKTLSTLSSIKPLFDLLPITCSWPLSGEKNSRSLAIINDNSNFLFLLVSVSVFIFPIDVPDPPKDVKVISSGSREMNISWTVGFDGNSAIQNYTVKISEDMQTFRDAICQGTLLKNNCVVYSTRVSIKKLFPWTTYYLRVFARNMIGSSHYSSVINVTTDEEGALFLYFEFFFI